MPSIKRKFGGAAAMASDAARPVVRCESPREKMGREKGGVATIAPERIPAAINRTAPRKAMRMPDRSDSLPPISQMPYVIRFAAKSAFFAASP